MNYLIVFLLMTTWCFRLNEGACYRNTLTIQNQLGIGRTLKVHCWSKDDNISVQYVEYHKTPFTVRFYESHRSRTIWRCSLWHGPYYTFSALNFRAYRGANTVRCAQVRLYNARLDGIYLRKNSDPEKYKYFWIKTA